MVKKKNVEYHDDNSGRVTISHNGLSRTVRRSHSWDSRLVYSDDKVPGEKGSWHEVPDEGFRLGGEDYSYDQLEAMVWASLTPKFRLQMLNKLLRERRAEFRKCMAAERAAKALVDEAEKMKRGLVESHDELLIEDLKRQRKGWLGKRDRQRVKQGVPKLNSQTEEWYQGHIDKLDEEIARIDRKIQEAEFTKAFEEEMSEEAS